jgi:hypothetical protein
MSSNDVVVDVIPLGESRQPYVSGSSNFREEALPINGPDRSTSDQGFRRRGAYAKLLSGDDSENIDGDVGVSKLQAFVYRLTK